MRCDLHGRGSRRSNWIVVDRGAGSGDFPPRGRSRGDGPYEVGRKLAALKRPVAAPTTPSAMIPPYQKPPVKVAQETGSEAGTQGPSSALPETHRPTTRASVAVLSTLSRSTEALRRTRTRYVEDIPEGITPVVTEHTILATGVRSARSWSSPKFPMRCRSDLATAPHDDRLDALRAGQHGVADRRSVQLPCADEADQRRSVADVASPARSPVPVVRTTSRRRHCVRPCLHADETSWRVAGKTHWLCAFANDDVTYYMIDRSRGEPALAKFFVEEFRVRWSAISGPLQRGGLCSPTRLPGPLAPRHAHGRPLQERRRALARVAKKLRRLVGDAIRSWRATEISPENRESRRQRLDERLNERVLA